MNKLTRFWDAWISPSRYDAPSFGAHGAVSATYNNTIDYNNRALFNPTTASVSVLAIPFDNALSIDSYVSDSESPNSYINLSIVSTEPPSNPFGAAIDNNHNLDLTGTGWTGDGSITIRATDGLENSSNLLSVSIHVGVTPPSCPYVYTWDGATFVEDNNILPTSEFPENIGEDVIDYYQLQQPPVEAEGQYVLQIREFENEHSYLDQFELWAVDHPHHLNVGTTLDGEIFTYGQPQSVDQATYQGDNVTRLVYYLDDNSLSGSDGDTVLLEFTEENTGMRDGGSALIGQAQKIPIEKKIAGFVRHTNSTNRDSSSAFILRQNSTVFAVPIGAMSVDSIQVKWDVDFSLDYTALASSLSEDFILEPLPITSAWHSKAGDVTTLLLDNDNIYAELIPGEIIELNFEVVSLLPGMVRDFVFVTKGRYEIGTEGRGIVSKTESSSYADLPLVFTLHPNHPNPFNPTTTIRYDLPEASVVSLMIYDILGREVRTLLYTREEAGFKNLLWDGKDNSGNIASAGIYIYALRAWSQESEKTYNKTRKMVLLK